MIHTLNKILIGTVFFPFIWVWVTLLIMWVTDIGWGHMLAFEDAGKLAILFIGYYAWSYLKES